MYFCFSETHPNLVYIEQKYGGHLGFYEGGLICPNPTTWLDRNVVNLADALAAYAEDNKGKMAATSSSEDTTDSEEEFNLLQELKLKPAQVQEVAPTDDEEKSVGQVSEVELETKSKVIKRPRFVCGRKNRVTFRVSKATRIACKI